MVESTDAQATLPGSKGQSGIDLLYGLGQIVQTSVPSFLICHQVIAVLILKEMPHRDNTVSRGYEMGIIQYLPQSATIKIK